MTGLVVAELLKVRTVRSFWAYLIVIVLLTGLAVAGEIGPAESVERDEVDFQVRLVESIGVAALLAIILGITIVTAEFRFGTITPTLLAEPRRELVVAAKALAGSLLALGFALLSLLVVVAVTLVWYGIIGADAQLTDGDVVTRVLQQLLLTVLWAAIGIAVGVLVQNQVAALVGTLVWIFLVEAIVVALLDLAGFEGVRGYLPFQALDAADGTGGDYLLSYGAGTAVAVAWIAALAVAGTGRLRRRDVT